MEVFDIFHVDQKMPNYLFNVVDLKFLLSDIKTNFFPKTIAQPQTRGLEHHLILDGFELKLISIKVNGKEVEKEDFQLTPCSITFVSPPTSPFTL